MIIEEAIIAMRSEGLTSFFKIFPFFVSDTFYIAVIALGYWLASKTRVFWQLGFLVPFSTMLNYILKNLFLCDRPDSSFHLVHIVDQSSGFPSGDVHITTVFWGMLICNFRSIPFRIIAISMILCVMASRVYLGVHTVVQVLGGLCVGGVTVWAMSSAFGRKMFSLWENGEASTYWSICWITILICVMTSRATMPLIFGLTGVLAGYGLSLGFAKNYMASSKRRAKPLVAMFGLGSLWLVNRFFPKMHFAPATWVDAIFIVKYCSIGLIIFALVPLMTKDSEVKEHP